MTTPLLLALILGTAACAQPNVIAERPGPQCIDKISDEEAAEIGRKIWEHEGGGKILVWWDDTANCSSFGINNYLWFQEGHNVPFQESFPPLIDYMLSKGADIPAWVSSKPPAPWKTRAELFAETLTIDRIRANPPKSWEMTPEMFAKQDSPRMKELKDFLASTIPLQARFSIQRMIDSLPKMLAAAPEADRPNIEKQFYRVACSRAGVFNLVDYVNFKGEGSNPKERYPSRSGGQPQGWGLLQVLQNMHGTEMGPAALNEFSDSAEWALCRRVDNAPPDRQAGDRSWLPGWVKRTRSYRGSGESTGAPCWKLPR
jgi:hypothetical protein